VVVSTFPPAVLDRDVSVFNITGFALTLRVAAWLSAIPLYASVEARLSDNPSIKAPTVPTLAMIPGKEALFTASYQRIVLTRCPGVTPRLYCPDIEADQDEAGDMPVRLAGCPWFFCSRAWGRRQTDRWPRLDYDDFKGMTSAQEPNRRTAHCLTRRDM
jgi:hypothetical protein